MLFKKPLSFMLRMKLSKNNHLVLVIGTDPTIDSHALGNIKFINTGDLPLIAIHKTVYLQECDEAIKNTRSSVWLPMQLYRITGSTTPQRRDLYSVAAQSRYPHRSRHQTPDPLWSGSS